MIKKYQAYRKIFRNYLIGAIKLETWQKWGVFMAMMVFAGFFGWLYEMIFYYFDGGTGEFYFYYQSL